MTRPDTPARCHACGLTAADWHEPEYYDRETSGGTVLEYVTETVRLTKTADGKYICKRCK